MSGSAPECDVDVGGGPALDCDVAVVGGGSAGCAAVHRLMVEGGGDVVLLEAGPDYGPATDGRWPHELLDVRVGSNGHDWGYAETLAAGGVLAHRRGRVLGGSSAVNPAGAVWPIEDDFDAWAALLDDDSWSAAALRGAIDAIEDASPPATCRGAGGALGTVQYADEDITAWGAAFAAAAKRLGLPELGDLSDPSPAGGLAVWHANVRGMTRVNAAFAFVDPHREDPRLKIRADTLVDRLILDGSRAVAVRCRTATGEQLDVHAQRVVLTAGAVGSPAILLRSGVGPATELRALGIPVAVDVPGVGKRLQDHVGVALAYDLAPAAQAAFDAAVAAGRIVQGQTAARLPNPVADSGGQVHLVPYEARGGDGAWAHVLSAWVMNPHSVGEIRLTDRAPEAPPAIQSGYLSDPRGADLATLRAGVDLLRALAAQPPIEQLVVGEGPPTAGRFGAALDAAIRAAPASYRHLAGTCRLGPASDRGAVADHNGLVRGTDNVVVADASAMPVIPSANTNLTAMLMGYKLAGRPTSRTRRARCCSAAPQQGPHRGVERCGSSDP